MSTNQVLWRAALAAALTTSLAACGGSGNPGSPTPTPTPVPTPPPPVVVLQGTGYPLESGFTGRMNFTTARAGALEATVDWTFATNDVDVLIAKGDCTFDQLEASQCNILGFAVSTTAKPEKVNIASTDAGVHTIFVENTGDRDESVSFQVVLSPTATGAGGPSASGRATRENPLGRKGPSRGHSEMR